MVIIDTVEEYSLLENNDCFMLDQAQISEIFHQVFEALQGDKLFFMNKLLTLPKWHLIFSVNKDPLILNRFKNNYFMPFALGIYTKVCYLKLHEADENIGLSEFNYFIFKLTRTSTMLLESNAVWYRKK